MATGPFIDKTVVFRKLKAKSENKLQRNTLAETLLLLMKKFEAYPTAWSCGNNTRKR
ncbi:hypothetical protein Hdeb2414_s0089g00787191 [Helianthus debilis subsp. tardiflorus]